MGWIIRIGPAVALGQTLYGTYFLCRSITSRSPASCASYQMFAGVVDAGLIPFFAISCYMSYLDYTSNTYGWSTLFNDNFLDYKIIQSFMYVCAAEGGLLLLSLVLDVYLAVKYRKITRLPPDMNPLEEKDNLTTRPHHKKNKSEILHEKHMSNSTLASQRFSQMSSDLANGRRVPYKHARTDSADRDSFSFQRDIVNEVKDPYSARASMNMDRGQGAVSRPSSAIVPAANARAAGAGLDHKPARSSGLAISSPPRPNSWLSYSNYEGVPVEISDYSQRELDAQVRSMSPVSAMSEHENHVMRNIPTAAPVSHPPASFENPPTAPHYQENDMPSPEQLSLALPPAYTPPKKRSRDPLGMNPPTPVEQRFKDESLMVRPLSISAYATPTRQALHETDANSVAQYATPASRPASFVGSGTKSRFYGNLRSSIGGSPTRASHDTDNFNDLSRSSTVRTAESANFEVYASDSEDDYDPYRSQPVTQQVRHGTPIIVGEVPDSREWNGMRQTSNSTGLDLQTGYAGLDPEFGKGMARRREVSGKVVEEGRGYELAAQTAEIQDSRLGAAGWARFKGL